MSSILNDVKHALNINEDDEAFDTDVKMHINSALATLTQLGVGPVEGFEVTGPEQKWSDFEADPRMSSIRSYVYLRVKLIFDPPVPSAIASFERQKQELEFRINVVADYG